MSIYVIDKDKNLIKISSLTVVKEGGGSPKFGSLVDKSIETVTATDLSGVSVIGHDVFADCTNLTSVVIPSNVKTISYNAFKGCSNLETLMIADGITSIENNAFDGINVREIIIPTTLPTLEQEVFANNLSLTSITIPESIIELEDDVFKGCTNLTEVTMGGKVPPIVTDTSIPSNVTAIKVPYSAYETYLEEWSAYADKIVRLPAIPSTIMVIVDNYLGEKVSGASVTITGNGLTFTGTTDSQGVFAQGDLQPATYTISVADYEGYKTPKSQEVIVTEASNNVANVTYLEKPAVSSIFGENGAEQIAEVSAVISANKMTIAEVEETYGWKIGDTKTIPLSTGENIEVRISDVNHDILSSDHISTAGLTLEMTHCMATKLTMTNDIYGFNTGGYPQSKLRTQNLPTIKATLPQEWQNVIKFVDKKSANGGGNKFTEVVTTSDDLFLLSAVELGFKESNLQNYTEEGSVYKFYEKASNSMRIKKMDTNGDGVVDTAQTWHSRTCYTNSNGMVYVSTSGRADGFSSSTNYSRGVSFAFCV